MVLGFFVCVVGGGVALYYLKVYFLWVVWNFAVKTLKLMGSQLMRALCASLESMYPTPSVFGAESSGWPEYNTDSPMASLLSPDWSRLVSHSPRREILYLLTSSAMTAVSPPAYMVLTFHVPILVCLLGVRRFRLLAVFRVHRYFLFSLGNWRVFFSKVWGFSFFHLCFCSMIVLWAGVASPKPNLP